MTSTASRSPSGDSREKPKYVGESPGLSNASLHGESSSARESPGTSRIPPREPRGWSPAAGRARRQHQRCRSPARRPDPGRDDGLEWLQGGLPRARSSPSS